MPFRSEAVLLRIFVGEQDRYGNRPLYEAIIQAAKDQGLAGATAFKGFMGYGAHSWVHSAKVLRLGEDLPIVIEIVDREECILSFLPLLRGMVKEGLVTMERVEEIRYPPEGE